MSVRPRSRKQVITALLADIFTDPPPQAADVVVDPDPQLDEPLLLAERSVAEQERDVIDPCLFVEPSVLDEREAYFTLPDPANLPAVGSSRVSASELGRAYGVAAYCRLYGRGVVKDKEVAGRLVRAGVALQDPLAAAVVAHLRLDGKAGFAREPERAVEELRVLLGGHVYATQLLGWCYDTASGVSVDALAAVELYRVASEAGYVVSQRNLGLSYEEGTGVEKNTTRALLLYRRAAAKGYSVAMYSIAW
jgi:TPR repeat protein